MDTKIVTAPHTDLFLDRNLFPTYMRRNVAENSRSIMLCDRKNEVRTIFDEEQFCSIEWWPNWLGIAVLDTVAVNRRHAWQMSQIFYKLKRHQTPHKMNKYTWFGVSLFMACTFGRKPTYHTNLGKKQYIETK